MPKLDSAIDPRSAGFRANEAAMRILLDDLRYWNAELQEAYRGPAEALQRWRALQNKT